MAVVDHDALIELVDSKSYPLLELVNRIRTASATKSLVFDRKKSGSNRKVMICSDCELFYVTICSRSEELWEITEVSEHGTRREEGLISPCMGSRRPSSKDLVDTGAFEALMNSRKSGEKISIGSIAEARCDCGWWIQEQQPCICALAVCNISRLMIISRKGTLDANC